ncbi:MAG: MarR family transcriptional regulator [Candidatus Marinimicrobia bacterium]|jgi:DNA-binding MarR family transcriptional regulator|nr:MarR family transcriptional regulator [Candidatus Neomarinimicrobiota bacterium]|tara:strand:- start:925 stop:1368 length:444 start_codon:yes stop_codon:yes gene_type:complete
MSTIEKSTGFLVVRTARSMKKSLDNNLAEFGITSPQHHVLSVLNDEDGQALSVIGKKVFLDKPAMTGLADRMENDKLVERRRYPEDRRVIKLFLTKSGKDILKKYEHIVKETDDNLVKVFSEEELAIFRKMLDRIWSNAYQTDKNGK